MKIPNYNQSSKLVPMSLFLDSVYDAFYSSGGWGFNQDNNSMRKQVFTRLFESKAHKLNRTEKIISNN